MLVSKWPFSLIVVMIYRKLCICITSRYWKSNAELRIFDTYFEASKDNRNLHDAWSGWTKSGCLPMQLYACGAIGTKTNKHDENRRTLSLPGFSRARLSRHQSLSVQMRKCHMYSGWVPRKYWSIHPTQWRNRKKEVVRQVWGECRDGAIRNHYIVYIMMSWSSICHPKVYFNWYILMCCCEYIYEERKSECDRTQEAPTTNIDKEFLL